MAVQFCVSEVDARTKWCPFARVINIVGAGGGNRWDESGSPAAAPNGSLCIASGCMAWRWVKTHINNPECPEGDLILSGDTHGFCGLAGYPATPRVEGV